MTDGQAGSAGEGTAPADEGKHYTAEDADVAETTSQQSDRDRDAASKDGPVCRLGERRCDRSRGYLGGTHIRNDSASSTAVVSILSSAFTAVGTLTTASFGIKASANTAKNSIASQQSGSPGPSN